MPLEKELYDGQGVKDMDADNEELMDHCALETMHAIDAKDKDGFRNGFHVLVSDMLNKMGSESKGDE